MSKVTNIECGFSNSQMRIPFALAWLDCGHCVGAGHDRYEYVCPQCKAISGDCGECVCGNKRGWNLGKKYSCHETENQTVKVGQEFDCNDCAKTLIALEDIKTKKDQIHHGRFMPMGGRHSLSQKGSYLFYKLDRESPSCFRLLCGVERNPISDKALKEMGVWGGVLSPTEQA